MPYAAITDPEVLQAIGAIGSLVATVVLLGYAGVQLRHLRDQSAATADQARAATQQVELMREAAAVEQRRRRDERRERNAEIAQERQLLHDQNAALIEQAQATRDAARAQLQPVMFAHALGAPRRGPNDDLDIDAELAAASYSIANEGTGLALDIEHGVSFDDDEFAFGGGMRLRAARPGESLPPEPNRQRPFAATFPLSVLDQANRNRLAAVYWCRFSNVFGDRFETRNSLDPREPPVFTRAAGPAV